jgi:hypothetical protein
VIHSNIDNNGVEQLVFNDFIGHEYDNIAIPKRNIDLIKETEENNMDVTFSYK